MRSLFDPQALSPMPHAPALARRSDPATSHAAAARIRPRVGGQCERILQLIRQYPNATAGELAMLSGGELDQVTVCKRVSVLERNGWITITGERRCTVLGNEARTYCARENANGS